MKEYLNSDIVIKWQPKLCQYSGICIKILPEVYSLKSKPWIDIQKAKTIELIYQIKKCPSGALSFRTINNQE
jgi:uncharacterized Fe-S cluster protein YjdI